ncbi:MAG TPA: trypsin-like peptidase domain-containing protein, partial [Pseudomonadota bacterium]|nr:trypsin-like peptidase domain-containing protein [Pseudomonadota bacterium]
MTSSKLLALAGCCFILCTGAAPAFAAAGARSTDAAPGIENSVVKVFATLRFPDPFKPWTKQAPNEVTASGVVIEGRRILTNAHVVLYASQVQIQANAAGDKVPATVVAVAPGIDLAVLKLDDPAFFDAHPAVARASELPKIKDAVLAYGFPTGGNSLSITKGIVSRIEFVSYNYPVSGLRIQVDAAINPGNSGGPAIAGDKMIGLAFSKLGGDTQNIGYIIPNEEVDLFLKDIADGHYDGKPAMYDDLQTLENPALRDYLKLDKSVEGMVVHGPYRTDASYPLKEWDVITHIGDTPIDNQGMIKLDKDLRVSFGYLTQQLAKNGKLALTVVRAGKDVRVELPVSAEHPTLVKDLRGTYPSYFIYGPLVFSTATWQLVSGVESSSGMLRLLGFLKSPLITRALDPPDEEREELVVISSPFFPHKLANGYSNPAGSVIYAINGTRIR